MKIRSGLTTSEKKNEGLFCCCKLSSCCPTYVVFVTLMAIDFIIRLSSQIVIGSLLPVTFAWISLSNFPAPLSCLVAFN